MVVCDGGGHQRWPREGVGCGGAVEATGGGVKKKMFFLAVCDVPLENKTDRFCRMIS